MGRKASNSLLYFNVDTDINEDDKIEYLESNYPNLFGYGLYLKLLTKIYQLEGYCLHFDDVKASIFSKRQSLDKEKVLECISFMCEIGLFDKKKYEKYKVLTSSSVQERFIVMSKRKTMLEFIEEYLCLNPYEFIENNEIKIKVTIKSINVTETNINVTEKTNNVTFMPQSKLNKSKLNKSSSTEKINVTKNDNNDINENLIELKNIEDLDSIIPLMFNYYCSKEKPHKEEIKKVNNLVTEDKRFKPETAFAITYKAFQKYPSLPDNKKNTAYLLSKIEGMKNDFYSHYLKIKNKNGSVPDVNKLLKNYRFK